MRASPRRTIAVLSSSSSSGRTSSGSTTSRNVLSPDVVRVKGTVALTEDRGPTSTGAVPTRSPPERGSYTATVVLAAVRPAFSTTTRATSAWGSSASTLGATSTLRRARAAPSGALEVTWTAPPALLFVSSDSCTPKPASAVARTTWVSRIAGVQPRASVTECSGWSAGSGSSGSGRARPEGSATLTRRTHGPDARAPRLETVTAMVLASPTSGTAGERTMSVGRTSRSASRPSTVSERLAVLSSSRDSRTWPAASATTKSVRVPARSAVA